MKKPHKHAEFIKAKADGETIQEMSPRRAFVEWSDMPADDWDFAESRLCRIKPEPPKYPQTRMTDTEVLELWRKGLVESAPFCDHVANGLRTFANAAIARAIEDGQVYVPDQPSSGEDGA